MSFIPDMVMKKAIDVIFMKYDRDHSNTLDSNELVGCFNELLGMVGVPTSVNGFVIKMIMKRMDKDGDGRINKPEFLNMFRIFESMAPQQQQPQNQNQNQNGWGGNQGGFNQPTSNQPNNYGNQGGNWGGQQGGYNGQQGGYNGQQGSGSGFGY